MVAGYVICIHLTQDMGQQQVLINIRIPQKAKNFLSNWRNY